MNKREKIKTLKAMHKYIDGRMILPGGFCETIQNIHPKVQDAEIPSMLKELGLIIPRERYSHDWWYDPYDRGVRLRAIIRAIKKLENA